MALRPGEKWEGGFVRDATGRIVVTRPTPLSFFWSGFLRDPDGRLCVVYV